MNFLRTIADTIFSWVLDANGESFNVIMNNDVLLWHLIALFVITTASVLVFYYVVAKEVINATKKNYLTVFVLGLLVLWLVDYFVISTIIDDFSYTWTLNNFYLSAINSLYYAILYGIISWFAKEGSNAKHISLWSIIKELF